MGATTLLSKALSLVRPNLDPPDFPFALEPEQTSQGMQPPGQASAPTLTRDLEENLQRIQAQFHGKQNASLVYHRLVLPLEPETEALVIYIDDQIDWEQLYHTTLRWLYHPSDEPAGPLEAATLVQRVLADGNLQVSESIESIVMMLLDGWAAVLIDGLEQSVLAEARGWAKRPVGRPTAEMTVRGPQEGFTEDLHTNLSLVRKRLRTPDLMVEFLKVGSTSRTSLAILYLGSVANPRLVAEVAQS